MSSRTGRTSITSALGSPQPEARLPQHWHSPKHPAHTPFSLVCACISLSVWVTCAVFIYTHAYIYTEEESWKEEPLFPLFSLTGLQVCGLEGAAPGGGEAAQTVRSLQDPLCTQRGRRDWEGLRPHLQCRLLLRAALCTTGLCMWKNNPLKVPGNPG